MPVADEPAATANRYCCVTIVTGDARTDVALPSSVPLTELMPGVIRLLRLPGGSRRIGDGHGHSGHEWALTPIGRSPLTLTDTLDIAGVLDGDLLTLDDVARADPPPAAASVRDAVEDAVDSGPGLWDASTTVRWLCWTTVVGLAALAIACAALPVPALAAATALNTVPAAVGTVPAAVGSVVALVAALVAAMVAALVAVRAGRRGDSYCAAAGLVSACLCGAVGAAAPLQQWTSRTGHVETTAGAAVAAALLVSAAVAFRWRPAIAAVVALATVLIAVTVLAVLASAGVDRVSGCLAIAVAVVMLLGTLPRLVLAATGLPDADPGGPDFPARFQVAGWALTGCLLGGSACVVAGVIPAAATDDRAVQCLALGVGFLTLLRARVFGQVCHTIWPRIAGTLVIAAVWCGGYRAAPSSRTELVVGAVVTLAALAALTAFGGPHHGSSVTGARTARALDAVEFLLVLAVLIGVAGELGLADWAMSVMG